jgi:hypothetical protein
MIWSKEVIIMKWIMPELVDLSSRDMLRRRAAYGEGCDPMGSGDWSYCDTGNSAGFGCDALGNSDQAYCDTGNNGD